ncbi:hypothetical protein WA158_006820 [Blastocystis sp. Blastoise]
MKAIFAILALIAVASAISTVQPTSASEDFKAFFTTFLKNDCSYISSVVYDEGAITYAFHPYNITYNFCLKNAADEVITPEQTKTYLNAFCNEVTAGEGPLLTHYILRVGSLYYIKSADALTTDLSYLTFNSFSEFGGEVSVALAAYCDNAAGTYTRNTYDVSIFPPITVTQAYLRNNPDGSVRLPFCRPGYYPSVTDVFSTNSGTINSQKCTLCRVGYYCPDVDTQAEVVCKDYLYSDVAGLSDPKVCIGVTTATGSCAPLFVGQEPYCNNGCEYVCDYGFGCDTSKGEIGEQNPPVICPTGQYSDTTDPVLCQDAQPGYTVVNSEVDKYGYDKDLIHIGVTECPKGYVCPDPLSPPVACVGQEYQDELGQTQCKVCDFFTMTDKDGANYGCRRTCNPYEVMINNECYPGCGCEAIDDDGLEWYYPSTQNFNGSLAYNYLEDGGYRVRECIKESNATHLWDGNCTWSPLINHVDPFPTASVSYDMIWNFVGVNAAELSKVQYHLQRLLLRVFPDILYRADVIGVHSNNNVESFLNDIDMTMVFLRAVILGDRLSEAFTTIQWNVDFREKVMVAINETIYDFLPEAFDLDFVAHKPHINDPENLCVDSHYCAYDLRANCTMAVEESCVDSDLEYLEVLQGSMYWYHGAVKDTCYAWKQYEGLFTRKCISKPYKAEWSILDPTGMWEVTKTDDTVAYLDVQYIFKHFPYTSWSANITHLIPTFFAEHTKASNLHDLLISPFYEMNSLAPNYVEPADLMETPSSGINVRYVVDAADVETVKQAVSVCAEDATDSICESIRDYLFDVNPRKFGIAFTIEPHLIRQL